MERQELIQKAIDASKKAYAPYSKFFVGAAVLTEDGRVFTGCNVENASYPAGICAERTAISKAVSEGARGIKEIVIVGGKKGVLSDYCSPCGICRQVMRQFTKNPENLKVILAKSPIDYEEYSLEELLPKSFKPEDLME